MAQFAYNNFNNTNIDHILYEYNYGYHSEIFFKNKCNAHSKSSLANKVTIKLRKLINVYCQNLLHIHNLQKQVKIRE